MTVLELRDITKTYGSRAAEVHALHGVSLSVDAGAMVAVAAAIVLLGIYALVILATESFAGIGSSGIGLGNQNHTNDVLSILGPAIFGHSTLASVLDHLLLLPLHPARQDRHQKLPRARLMCTAHKACGHRS